MKIHLFEHRPDAHMRKAQEYLEEAYLARIEHQVAAEHHGALAKMYAERITRIEAEIHNIQRTQTLVAPLAPPAELADAGERLKPDSVVVYPSRNTRS